MMSLRKRRKGRQRLGYLSAALLAAVLTLISTLTPQTALAALDVSGVVNTYAPVTNISGTDVTIGATTGAAAPFAVGNTALLIQMTGAPPGAVNASRLGVYEMQQVTGVSGSTITLAAINNSYEFNTEAVQLVRVPSDPAMTVTGNVTALPWNGSTGGVVALTGGTLTLDANIDASGAGFSGGAYSGGPFTNGFPVYDPGLHAETVVYPITLVDPGSPDGRGLTGFTNLTHAPPEAAGTGGGGLACFRQLRSKQATRNIPRHQNEIGSHIDNRITGVSQSC